MSSVFISYIRENREIIDKLYEALTSYGIDVWIDWRSLEPGDLWEHKIRQAIREGAFFIPCFSKEYNDRDETYMEEELNVAIKVLRQKSLGQKWCIPVKLNECEIPDYDIGRGETLRSFQYADLSEDWDTGIQRLLKSISPEISEAEEHFRIGDIKAKQDDHKGPKGNAMPYRKKLIEVALPLDDINREAAREKSIRHGHPSTLHLWWARRPLAACRAVLFASLVDDPSNREDLTEAEQEREREDLFDLIRELVKWENINNEHVLEKARAEILKSTDGNPPPVLDPFCGGGSIPLEAQRLGLEAHGSDLNPVAVLITKAMIEIPPRFAGQPPVNPDAQNDALQSQTWQGTMGLAEDVRYYGEWMRSEAEKRIGHLYPKVKVPKEQGGGEATVIAWLWARTVKCPNPACEAKIPLITTFWLSKRQANKAWVEPVVDKANKTVRFEVKTGDGTPPDPTKIGRGARFRCLVCCQDSPEEYIKNESMEGRMNVQLMAIVAEGQNARIYLPPSDKHVQVAESAKPKWAPEAEMNRDTTTLVSGRGYGFFKWADLFTKRQLTVLSTLSDLVNEAREKVQVDATNADCKGAEAYANAVGTYLAFDINQLANHQSTACGWNSTNSQMRSVFARQATLFLSNERLI